MVPLAIRYLGKEQYGVWATVASLVAMMQFLDGGAGNAAINMISHQSGARAQNLPRIVSTSFFLMLLLASCGAVLFVSVAPLVRWGALLGVQNDVLQSQVKSLVILVGCVFFLNMIVSLTGHVQRGLQEGQQEHWASVLGSVLSLGFVFWAIVTDQGLLGFATGLLAGPVVSQVLNFAWFFFQLRPDLRPRWTNVDVHLGRDLLGVGGMFLVLQFASTVQSHADNVMIAHMLGASAVAGYSVCMKVFMSATIVFGLVLAPLWPAYREALGSGDGAWVRRVYYRSLRWSLTLSIPLAALLVLSGKELIALWVGPSVVPSQGLLLGCGAWMILYTIGMGLGALLNSLQLLILQTVMASLSTIANVGLTIMLIPRWGVEGAVWGSVISYLACSLIPWLLVVRYKLGRLDDTAIGAR